MRKSSLLAAAALAMVSGFQDAACAYDQAIFAVAKNPERVGHELPTASRAHGGLKPREKDRPQQAPSGYG